MKRTKTASVTEKLPNKKTCDHSDTHPAAVFLDEALNEAWMFQVCDNCGAAFLLLGTLRPEICG